ncbi:hypothetical protein [Amycolatopsis palatopharyngis]|uniref:hypothetical protein n=1 Tax=Amycolatopsis palatopharyngis TaxID=187982 RepID=UPI000E26E5EB|nr:hypothetical protein [Amycolatopsis palatopharyngis]
MATVSVQQITTGGVAPTYSPASVGGDKIIPGAGTFLHVKNAHTAAQDCVIVTPGTVDGLAIADRTVTVPNAGERWIYVPATLYRASDGFASITWSGTTAMTFAALKV